jgi:hypothetical protein
LGREVAEVRDLVAVHEDECLRRVAPPGDDVVSLVVAGRHAREGLDHAADVLHCPR